MEKEVVMKNSSTQQYLSRIVLGAAVGFALATVQGVSGQSGQARASELSGEYFSRGEQNVTIATSRNNLTRAQVNFGLFSLEWSHGFGHTRYDYDGDWCRYFKENRSNSREIKAYNKQRKPGDFERALVRCDEGQSRFDEFSLKVKSLAETPVEMDIRRVSGDGASWVLEFSIRNPILSEYLVSKRDMLRFRAPLAWVKCDGRVLMLGGSGQENWNRPLEDVIASFHGFLPYDFMKCDFKVDSEKVMVSDDITPIGQTLPKLEILNPIFTFQSDGTFYMQQVWHYVEGWQTSLFRFSRTRENDAAMRQKAMLASRQFVSLIQGHGRLLLELASASELSQAERELAVKSALRVKKPEILAQLEALNQGFGELSMVEKLAVSASVREAYGYVRVMEVKAAKLLESESRLNLDLSMQRDSSQ